MTFEDFTAAIDDLAKRLGKIPNDKYIDCARVEENGRISGQRWNKPLPSDISPHQSYSRVKNQPHIKVQNALLNQWIVSGSEGSDYSETSSSRYFTRDKRPEFTLLIMILDDLAPNLLFKDWREIQSQLIQSGEWSESDYYSNTDNYVFEWVDLSDLYNFLEDKKLLDTQESSIEPTIVKV